MLYQAELRSDQPVRNYTLGAKASINLGKPPGKQQRPVFSRQGEQPAGGVIGHAIGDEVGIGIDGLAVVPGHARAQGLPLMRHAGYMRWHMEHMEVRRVFNPVACVEELARVNAAFTRGG